MLSKMVGEITINVDGKQAAAYQNILMGSAVPLSLIVGDKEKHDLRFQINTPKFFGAFRESKIQVYVDGKLLKEF